MFRANFQRTGLYNTTGVRQVRGLKWKFRQSPTIESWMPDCDWSPTVENGVVCVNTPSGDLYGLDSQTGQQLWVCQLGKGKKFSSLGIADGTVYVSSRQLDSSTTDEYLHAVDIHSGQQKWKFKLLLQPSSISIDSVLSFSSPAVTNKVVYMGGGDGKLYALDALSGELIWSFKTTKNIPLTSPAVDKEIICVCSRDGYLYAVELTTRQQLWKFEIGAMPLVSPYVPAIASGRVYIPSSDNTLYALNLYTGQPIWTFKAGNLPFYSPAITEQILCVGSGEDRLYALDVETGQPMWTFKTGEMLHCSSPIIANLTLYIGNPGYLQALDLETGKQLWHFETPLPDQWMLDPQLWFYKLANQLVKAFTRNTFALEKFSSPAIADGIIYVSCGNGYLYALH